MRNVCLMLARLALSAWIGAAVLFVVTSVREVRSPDFDSETKDRLVALRFPPYYACGFTLVSIGVAGTLVSPLSRQRIVAVVATAGLALLLMVFDSLWIYNRLIAMISPPGNPRTEAFTTLHYASEGINTAVVGLCVVAACLLNWPDRRNSNSTL